MHMSPLPSAPSVLMTADAVGGVWTYAVELCAALGRHGVKVALCTMGALPSEAQRQELSELQNVRLFESTYRLEWMDDPWDDVARAGEWLLDVARAVRPDVVHLNGYAHGPLPFGAPVLMVGHSCVLSWFEAVKGERAPERYDRYRAEVTAGLRAADHVVAPTAAMREALARHYGPLPAGKVSVIHNARERMPLPLGEPGAMRDREPFILSAGRLWDEAKNVAALAEIAHDLPWPVRVAGETVHPSGGPGIGLPGGPGAGAGLQPLGRLGPLQLAEQMRRAAIYALPARYEPFGLSVLEAAQRGCALVLGDIPSLREVWGEAALFVPPEDPRALREAIRSLIDTPSRLRSLATAAHARASRYRADRMGALYLEHYAHLRAPRAPAAPTATSS